MAVMVVVWLGFLVSIRRVMRTPYAGGDTASSGEAGDVFFKGFDADHAHRKDELAHACYGSA